MITPEKYFGELNMKIQVEFEVGRPPACLSTSVPSALAGLVELG